MSFLLKIDSGALSETARRIESGHAVRIGRAEPSDIVIAEDSTLSRLHFEVSFTSDRCQLRDLGSTNGTRVNGVYVRAIFLKAGDQILAGQTSFSIAWAEESATKTHSQDPPDYDRLLNLLAKHFQPLFAIVDAARDPAVLQLLLSSKQPYFWLYQGDEAAQLLHFAPYLVWLDPHGPLLEKLIRKAWGNNWGIFFTSDMDISGLQACFAGLGKAILPDDTCALFRYYDPRVFRIIGASCDRVQLHKLFGHVRSYILEAENASSGVSMSLTPEGLKVVNIPLTDQAEITHRITQPVFSAYAQFEWALHAPFQLRQDQAEMLQAQQSQNSIWALVKSMRELYPRDCELITDRELQLTIDHALKICPGYGIRDQVHMFRYAFLMLKLGRHFDVDPELPWASQTLHMRLRPDTKLDRLMGNIASTAHSKNKTISIPLLTNREDRLMSAQDRPANNG